MKHLNFGFFLFILILTSCQNSPNPQNPLPIQTSPYGTFAKGADISWLPQMEATGYIFKDTKGNPQDCLTILKDHGIESIRLRVWVNPSNNPQNGHNSPAEMVSMAKRVTDSGFRLMIDFHYSDTWADPGKQVKPVAWASHSFTQLKSDVYDHTYSVMKALAHEGIFPEWVQVGNEINPGMLLPDGSISNFSKLADLLNSGYDAVKKASPTSKVIIHLASGVDDKFCRFFFDGITAVGAHFDVIGLSYYPYWIESDYTATIAALSLNLNDMASRYNKDVMIVEVGGEDTKPQNTYDTILAAMDRVNAVPEGRGLGIFYWEPQGAKNWSGYGLSAWGNDGRPSTALEAFLATPQSRAIPKDPAGSIYTFFSTPKSRYVSVNTAESGRMSVASATVASDAERFTLFNNTDGTVSFKSLANGKYVSARTTTQILSADASKISETEKFTLIERADGFRSIHSVALNTSWHADEDFTIKSTWNDPTSSWQSFMVFKVN